MANIVAAANPIQRYQNYNDRDLTMPIEMDHCEMEMPLMPPTPPSSFDYLPHRADGHHPPHHFKLLQIPNDDFNAVSTGHHCRTDAMGVMADDAQLFEHALMAMREDQQTYIIEETKSRNLEIRTKSRNHSAVQKIQPIKGILSRAKGARANVAVRPPPRPSLAATHPALYNKTPATPPKNQPQTMLPTPPPEIRREIKSQPDQKPLPPPPTYRLPLLPWKVYTDPNKLLSAEPQFDDPMYRMLKMDVNPDQPNVVSPLFMIGMPCGSLIEAANYYGDDEMHT